MAKSSNRTLMCWGEPRRLSPNSSWSVESFSGYCLDSTSNALCEWFKFRFTSDLKTRRAYVNSTSYFWNVSTDFRQFSYLSNKYSVIIETLIPWCAVDHRISRWLKPPIPSPILSFTTKISKDHSVQRIYPMLSVALTIRILVFSSIFISDFNTCRIFRRINTAEIPAWRPKKRMCIEFVAGMKNRNTSKIIKMKKEKVNK